MFLGESHPGIATCYNNIGEMFDLKGNTKQAKEFFKKGLDMKLKCNSPVLSIVMSQCNTAKILIPERQFKEAHSLIDNGFERLKKEKLPPREAEALLYHTKGLVYKQEKRFYDAVEMFLKAKEIKKDIAPSNTSYAESVSQLAEMYKLQGNLTSSLNLGKTVLELKDKIIDSTPHTLVIADTLESIAEVYSKQGDVPRHTETLGKLQSELLRLERVFLSHQNDRDLCKIRDRLRDLQSGINPVHHELKGDELISGIRSDD